MSVGVSYEGALALTPTLDYTLILNCVGYSGVWVKHCRRGAGENSNQAHRRLPHIADLV